jgi:hypothetical protein
VRQISGTPLRILEALWRDHYFGKKLGLTLKDLAASLPSPAKVGQQLSIPAIRQSLEALFSRSLILSGDLFSVGRGRPAGVVRIDVDNVVTWPSTASIILRLHARRNSMCPVKPFIEDLLSLKLLDQDGNAQTVDLVPRQISFARKRGYIATVPEHDDILTTTTRVWEEYQYLKYVSQTHSETLEDRIPEDKTERRAKTTGEGS